MPGRKFEASSDYRYGFNGKEKDKDMNSLTVYDYGFRIYNPAIGKFLSVDPLSESFPWNSPYSYAEGDPINFIDLDGLDKASPELLEKARTYADVFHTGLLNRLTELKVATDKKVIEELKKEVGTYKKGYAFWINYLYKNTPKEAEQKLIELNTIIETTLALLNATPAGDIKVLATGTKSQGQKQSRAVAAGFLVFDMFGGSEVRMTKVIGKVALSAMAKGLKNANVYGKCTEFVGEFVSKFSQVMKDAKAEMKTFEINIGGEGIIGTLEKKLSDNGMHQFVEVTKDGKSYIFDNLHPQGVVKEDYVKSLEGLMKNGTEPIKGEDLIKTYSKEIKEEVKKNK